MSLFSNENPKIEIHYHQLQELIPFMVKLKQEPDQTQWLTPKRLDIEILINDESEIVSVTTLKLAKNLLSKITYISQTDLSSIGYILNGNNVSAVKVSLITLFKILSENCKNIQLLEYSTNDQGYKCDEGICNLIKVSPEISEITIANISKDITDRLIKALNDKPQLMEIKLYFKEEISKDENTNKFIRFYQNHKINYNSDLKIIINNAEIDYNNELPEEIEVESIRKSHFKTLSAASKSWMVKLAIFIVGVIATSIGAYYLFNRKASSNVVLPNLLPSETPVIPATLSSTSMESPLKLLAETQLARRNLSSGNSVNL